MVAVVAVVVVVVVVVAHSIGDRMAHATAWLPIRKFPLCTVALPRVATVQLFPFTAVFDESWPSVKFSIA